MTVHGPLRNSENEATPGGCGGWKVIPEGVGFEQGSACGN